MHTIILANEYTIYVPGMYRHGTLLLSCGRMMSIILKTTPSILPTSDYFDSSDTQKEKLLLLVSLLPTVLRLAMRRPATT